MEVQSLYLRQYLLYIEAYKGRGIDGINDLKKESLIIQQKKTVFEYISRLRKWMSYDFYGNKKEYYLDDENESDARKLEELLSIRNELVISHLSELVLIHKKKKQYLNQIDSIDYINEVNGSLNLEYYLEHSSLNKLSIASEILTMAYARNSYYPLYSRDYLPIELVIYRVAEKLSCLNSLYIKNSFLCGNFEDNSSFKIGPVLFNKDLIFGLPLIEQYEEWFYEFYTENRYIENAPTWEQQLIRKYSHDEIIEFKKTLPEIKAMLELFYCNCYYKSGDDSTKKEIINDEILNIEISTPFNFIKELGSRNKETSISFDFSMSRFLLSTYETEMQRTERTKQFKAKYSLNELIKEGRQLLRMS